MCLKEEFVCTINIALKSGNAKRDKSIACTGRDSSIQESENELQRLQCGELV